jgi:hypothetical protein
LHKLRASQISAVVQLQHLKDLQLEVCSTIRLALAFEGTTLQYDLPVWDWMMGEDTLYVRSDPARPLTISDALLANAIGEGLTDLFRLADGGDFARILACGQEDRLELLRRLCGDSVSEDIAAIEAEYVAFNARSPGAASFSVTPAPSLPSRCRWPPASVAASRWSDNRRGRSEMRYSELSKPGSS